MKKKFLTLGIAFLMLFSLAACNDFDLASYKAEAKAEIENYATESNYCTENWSIVCGIVDTGKRAVDAAENKAGVDTAVNDTKIAIDEVKEEMADFVLTISVDNNTKNRGEDFVVEVSLKNQSGEDISISYYYSPVSPFIENWQYPYPPFELPPEPDVIIIENGESFHETWRLGASGYTNPITNERSSLPVGTHELKFRVLIIISQSETIVWSNTIKLMVK